MIKVTEVVVFVTTSPYESSTTTTGCDGNAPFELPGCWVNAKCAAVPATVKPAVVAGVNDPSVARACAHLASLSLCSRPKATTKESL